MAIAETTFGTNLGVNVTLEGSATTALFSESQSRFVVTVKPEFAARFEEVVTDAKQIGVVTEEANIVINSSEQQPLIEGTVAEFQDAWKGAIPCLLKSEA